MLLSSGCEAAGVCSFFRWFEFLCASVLAQARCGGRGCSELLVGKRLGIGPPPSPRRRGGYSGPLLWPLVASQSLLPVPVWQDRVQWEGLHDIMLCGSSQSPSF